ncbi:hypothetical protein [Streptomyces jeddahensis]|uniref:Uncharacterized protein n=1 Tax=Streptomyces jeddahensis TaxID=1716141 RepID=A0A177HUE0_9ACTN|nr:hypothetical protein [Streptomyces jeddahensis]OAH14346.1 hypothetical protein STSP_22930 [Streptomyces jeddahensis]
MKAVAHTVAFHDPLPDIERTVRGDEHDGSSDRIKDGITADFGRPR